MRRFQSAVSGVLLLPCGAALADEFTLSPMIALRQKYISNVFFDSRKEEDDFIPLVRAGVEMVHRTERPDTRLAGCVVPFFYWEEDNLNAVGPGLLRQRLFEAAPRFTVEAEAALNVEQQRPRSGYRYNRPRIRRQPPHPPQPHRKKLTCENRPMDRDRLLQPRTRGLACGQRRHHRRLSVTRQRWAMSLSWEVPGA